MILASMFINHIGAPPSRLALVIHTQEMVELFEGVFEAFPFIGDCVGNNRPTTFDTLNNPFKNEFIVEIGKRFSIKSVEIALQLKDGCTNCGSADYLNFGITSKAAFSFFFLRKTFKFSYHFIREEMPRHWD